MASHCVYIDSALKQASSKPLTTPRRRQLMRRRNDKWRVLHLCFCHLHFTSLRTILPSSDSLHSQASRKNATIYIKLSFKKGSIICVLLNIHIWVVLYNFCLFSCSTAYGKEGVKMNFVDRIFVGELTSTIMCEECEHVSISHLYNVQIQRLYKCSQFKKKIIIIYMCYNIL